MPSNNFTDKERAYVFSEELFLKKMRDRSNNKGGNSAEALVAMEPLEIASFTHIELTTLLNKVEHAITGYYGSPGTIVDEGNLWLMGLRNIQCEIRKTLGPC